MVTINTLDALMEFGHSKFGNRTGIEKCMDGDSTQMVAVCIRRSHLSHSNLSISSIHPVHPSCTLYGPESALHRLSAVIRSNIVFVHTSPSFPPPYTPIKHLHLSIIKHVYNSIPSIHSTIAPLTSEQNELRRPFEQVPPISSISRPLSKQAFCPTELVQPLQSFIFFTLYVVKNINHSVSWTVPLHLVKSHHCNCFPQFICGNCVGTRGQFV